MSKENKIIYFKHNIDKDTFNKYYDFLKTYINSHLYEEKYDKYVVEFFKTYAKKLELENNEDNIRRLINFIAHRSHYDDATETFTENFKYYLILRNKSVADVSKDLHIPYSTVNDWYNGKKYPRVDNVGMLADYFNIDRKNLTQHRNEIQHGVAVPVLGNIPARYTY